MLSLDYGERLLETVEASNDLHIIAADQTAISGEEAQARLASKFNPRELSDLLLDGPLQIRQKIWDIVIAPVEPQYDPVVLDNLLKQIATDTASPAETIVELKDARYLPDMQLHGVDPLRPARMEWAQISSGGEAHLQVSGSLSFPLDGSANAEFAIDVMRPIELKRTGSLLVVPAADVDPADVRDLLEWLLVPKFISRQYRGW